MADLKKILILTNGALARNPRVVKEAHTLGAAGYDVTVLGVRNHAPSVGLDNEISRHAPFSHEQIDMLGGITSRIRRAHSRFARELKQRGGPESIEMLGPAHALLKRARMIKSDLVIAHNEIAHWAGIQLISEGRRVAADIEDWHSEDLPPETRNDRPQNLLRKLEAELLNRAAYCTTTSEILSSALHDRYGGRRPIVVTNSFPLQANPREGTPGRPPSIHWFSQTIGPGRGLEEFLSIWGNTQEISRFVLQGQLQTGYFDRLIASVPEKKRSLIEVLPPVAPNHLPAAISKHDIGLAFEQPAIASRNLTITNKILQYLNAGLAIVASNTEGQREVLSKLPNAGLILDTKDARHAISALDELIGNPSILASRQQSARQLAKLHYCWEQEEGKLVKLVAATIEMAAR